MPPHPPQRQLHQGILCAPPAGSESVHQNSIESQYIFGFDEAIHPSASTLQMNEICTKPPPANSTLTPINQALIKILLHSDFHRPHFIPHGSPIPFGLNTYPNVDNIAKNVPRSKKRTHVVLFAQANLRQQCKAVYLFVLGRAFVKSIGRTLPNFT